MPDFRKLDWLFPETTANFDKLVIQYRGFCGYTFAATDGLLLPGMLLEGQSTLVMLVPCPVLIVSACLSCEAMLKQAGDVEVVQFPRPWRFQYNLVDSAEAVRNEW